MTAVSVQTSLFEHGRIFIQCCTVFLYSTCVSYCTLHNINCTQFREFTKKHSFILSLMNICIVLYSISVQQSTDCTPYTNIRTRGRNNGGTGKHSSQKEIQGCRKFSGKWTRNVKLCVLVNLNCRRKWIAFCRKFKII